MQVAVNINNIKKLVNIFWLAILIFYCNLSNAQSGFCRVVNETSGLPIKSINDILFDGQSYWIGSENGLIKFDGTNFFNLNPHLNNYKISNISELKYLDNDLYIKYSNLGFLRYNINGDKFTQISDKNIIDVEPITKFIRFELNTSGKLYLIKGTVKSLIFNFKVPCDNGKLCYFNYKLYILIPNVGLFSYSLNGNSINYIDGFLNADRKSDFSISTRKLHLIYNYNVFQIDSIHSDSKFKYFKREIPEKVTCFYFLNDSLYYYIYNNKKIIRAETIKGVEIRNVYTYDIIINYELKNIISISDKNIFVGTNQGIIWFGSQDHNVKSIDDNWVQDSNIRVRRSILELSPNEFILNGYPNSYYYKNGKLSNYFTNKKYNIYNSFYYNGYIYATTQDDGVIRIDKKTRKVNNIYSNKTSNNNTYKGLYFDSTNFTLIAGGLKHFIVKSLKNNRNDLRVIELGNSIIRVIKKDKLFNLFWIGTSNGIYILDSKFNIIRQFTANGSSHLSDDFISDILIVNGTNEVWIANKKGVDILPRDLYSKTPTVDIHPDYLKNSVFLNLDNQHRIWIGTYQGLIVYDPQKNLYIRFTKSKYLINNEYNFTSSLLTSSGNIIAGGLNGYDIINTNHVKLNNYKDKNIHISNIFKISQFDTSLCQFDTNKTVSFYSEKEYLSIYINSYKYFKNNSDEIEYSIDNRPWIRLRADYNINISSLETGEHILNIHSLENPDYYITLKIISLIPFYKSIKFTWALVLLLLGIISIYLFTIFNIKKNRQKLRRNIANDLHDEVGTLLTRAIYHSKKINEQELSSVLETTIQSLRAYIDTLSNKRININTLVDEINEMKTYNKLFSAIDFKLNINNIKDVQIKKILYRDLKLIVSELFANIIKHSLATKVIVDLSMKKNTIKIVITDNGRLTQIDTIYNAGYGIQNILKRVKNNNGTINFKVNETYGLTVDLSMPIK